MTRVCRIPHRRSPPPRAYPPHGAGTIASYLGLNAVESIHVPVPVNFVFVVGRCRLTLSNPR